MSRLDNPKLQDSTDDNPATDSIINKQQNSVTDGQDTEMQLLEVNEEELQQERI